jgi:hypothetical protein
MRHTVGNGCMKIFSTQWLNEALLPRLRPRHHQEEAQNNVKYGTIL